MRQIIRILAVGFIVLSFMTSTNAALSGSEYNSYWNVADSSSGRSFDARMVDRLAYVSNGQTVDNLLGITNSFTETRYNGLVYKPRSMDYTVYTRAYTVSTNPVASVSVTTGPTYTSTITNIQQGYSVTGGLDYYVQLSATASVSFTDVDFTYSPQYQSDIGGPITYYDSYGYWYPNAKVSFLVNDANPSTTSFESNDVVRLGVDSTDIAAMGGDNFFDILIIVNYQWAAWGCVSKDAYGSCTQIGITNTLSYTLHLQLGRPGIQDGNNGNDGEISRYLVSGEQ